MRIKNDLKLRVTSFDMRSFLILFLNTDNKTFRSLSKLGSLYRPKTSGRHNSPYPSKIYNQFNSFRILS